MRPTLHHQRRFPGSPAGAMAMFLIILASCLLGQLTQASKLQEQSGTPLGKTSARRTQSQPEWRTTETTTSGSFEPATSARTTTPEQPRESSVNETQQVDIGSSSMAPEAVSVASMATTSGSTESSPTTTSSASVSTTSAETSGSSAAPAPSSMSMSLDGMLMNSRPRAEASSGPSSKSSRGHKKAARQGEQAKSSRRIPPSGPQFVSPATKGQRSKAKQLAKQQEKPIGQQQRLLSNSSSLKSASNKEARAQDNSNDGNSLIDGLDLMRNILGTQQQPQQISSMMNNPDDMVMSVMSSADGKERRLVMIARDTLDTLQRFAADEAKRQQQEQQQQVVATNGFMQPLTTTTDSSSVRDQTQRQMTMNEGWTTVGTSSENPSTDSTTATKTANSSSEASVDLGSNRDSLREVPVSTLVDRTSSTQSGIAATSTSTSPSTSTTSTSTSLATTTTDAIRSTSAIDTTQRLTNGQQRMVVAINQQQEPTATAAGQPTTGNRSTGFRGETGSRKLAANRQGDTRLGAPAGKTNGAAKRKNNKPSINKQTTVGGTGDVNGSKQVAAKLTGNTKPRGNGSLRAAAEGTGVGGGLTGTSDGGGSSSAGEPPVAINQSSFDGSTQSKRANSRATTVANNKQTGANQQQSRTTTTGAGSTRTLVAFSSSSSSSVDDSDADNFSLQKSTSSPSPRSGAGQDASAGSGEQQPLGELDSLRATIPGEPLLDYPIYSAPPKSSFECQSQSCPGGYYADLDSQCQAFHICQNDGRFDTFLCPNGTIFSQQHFVCVWWWQADCQQSASFFKLNDNIYCNSMVLPSSGSSSTSNIQRQLSGSVAASEGGMPNMNDLGGSSLSAGSMGVDLVTPAPRVRTQESNNMDINSLDNSAALINRMLSMEPDNGKQIEDSSSSTTTTTSATLTANSDSDLQQQRLELPSSHQ